MSEYKTYYSHSSNYREEWLDPQRGTRTYEAPEIRWLECKRNLWKEEKYRITCHSGWEQFPGEKVDLGTARCEKIHSWIHEGAEWPTLKKVCRKMKPVREYCRP